MICIKNIDRQDIERPEEHGALVKSIAESAFKNNYGEMLIAKKDGGCCKRGFDVI